MLPTVKVASDRDSESLRPHSPSRWDPQALAVAASATDVTVTAAAVTVLVTVVTVHRG